MQSGTVRQSDVLWYASLIALVAIIFGSIAQHDFVVWDDNIHIYANPHLFHPSFSSVAYFWVHPYRDLYIPLSYTLFLAIGAIAWSSTPIIGAADVPVFFDPHVFHAASLILHIANTLLVFRLIKRILGRGQAVPQLRLRLASALGAALFAVHPLQVESVAWVSEIRGLFGAFLSLGALLAYLPKQSETTTPAWRIGIATVLGILALLAKPSCATVPIIAIAFDILFLNKSLAISLRGTAIWLTAAVADVWITGHVQSVPAHILTSAWTRPLIAGDTYVYYLWRLIAPWPMTINYQRTPQFVMRHTWVYFEWIIPLGLTIFAFAIRKRMPIVCLGLVIFGLTILPVSGIVPFIFQDYSTVADRYIYMAMIGPALILAWAILTARSQWAIATPAIAVMVVFGIMANIQAGNWRDSLTLLRHAVDVDPTNAPAYNNISTILYKSGDYNGALQSAQQAVAAKPDFADAWVNLGNAVSSVGQKQAALNDYEKAITLEPRNVDAYVDLGNAFFDERKLDLAAQEFNAARSAEPSRAQPYVGLGNVRYKLGDVAGAENYYRSALALDPNVSDAHEDLGACLANQGQLDAAIAEFRSAIALDPNNTVAQSDLKMALSMKGNGQ